MLVYLPFDLMYRSTELTPCLSMISIPRSKLFLELFQRSKINALMIVISGFQKELFPNDLDETSQVYP